MPKINNPSETPQSPKGPNQEDPVVIPQNPADDPSRGDRTRIPLVDPPETGDTPLRETKTTLVY